MSADNARDQDDQRDLEQHQAVEHFSEQCHVASASAATQVAGSFAFDLVSTMASCHEETEIPSCVAADVALEQPQPLETLPSAPTTEADETLRVRYRLAGDSAADAKRRVVVG